jgi:hypothetical protein
MAERRAIVPCAPSFGRIAQLDPARDPLIEHSEIAISLRVQFLVGQTGQLVGARSVKHNQPVARDLTRPRVYAIHRNR